MKKTLTAAALSSVLVLGLATSALAVHETPLAETGVVTAGASKITIDGNVRERGVYDYFNAWENNDDEATARSYYDSRVQLGVTAKVSEHATGRILLESGAENSSSDVDTWGENGDAGLHTGGSKLGTLSILESWINYNPGAWGVKAGHMPLALGNKVFFDHTTSGDDAIVFYGNLGEATHLAALTIKFEEDTTTDYTDDLDGYVALVTTKINDALNLGANYTYLRGGSDTQGNFDGVDSYVLENKSGLSLNNLGLTADGKIGPIDYLVDVELQTGMFVDNIDADSDSNVDTKGWATKLGANYDLGAGKVGLLFGYGSGNEHDRNGEDSNTSFLNFLSDTNYETIIAGYRSVIPGNGLGLGQGDEPNHSGLSNLTLYQLNGSTKTVCPLTGKDLSLFSSLSYMQLSEDMDDLEGHEVDNVGTEVDLIATWALTPGLNYKVEAAYLWTGDVYENHADYGGVDNDPEDLAFVRHSLDLKF